MLGCFFWMRRIFLKPASKIQINQEDLCLSRFSFTHPFNRSAASQESVLEIFHPGS
jgi:hypothetical protein